MTIIQAISDLSTCWLVLGGAFALVFTVAGIREALSRVREWLNKSLKQYDHFDEGE